MRMLWHTLMLLASTKAIPIGFPLSSIFFSSYPEFRLIYQNWPEPDDYISVLYLPSD